jgi:hypothetical protein
VADPDDFIVVGVDGSMVAASRSVERRLRDRAGQYRLTIATSGLLVLKEDRSRGSEAARVIMAGEILGKMTVLEVISVIANANWRGELTIHDAEGTERALILDQGALKVARSNHTDDLLGEVLYRQGIIDRSTLDEILRQISPDRRFGQLCVDHGILDQESLFAQLQEQAQQIFFGSMLMSDGAYAFCTIDDAAVPPAHTVHIPVQGLLMEGVQRIDEMALFRERIPNPQLCPAVREDAPERDLDETTRTVLLWCDGGRTIEEIARESGLGEFHTTKTIYHLLQQKQVELHTSGKIDEDAVRRLVMSFNDVMRDIFMAVATYGGIDETRQTLSTWIQGSGYAPFFGREVDEDGTIDANHVIEVLKGVRIERPVEALHQALHELVAFALFSATTALPRGQELSLARDVNQRLKAIRL